MKFDFIFLGQSVLKYETPLDVFTTINQIYEQNFNTLHKANKQLVGKIKDEHSLFYDGEDESKVQRHNRLPMNVTAWFLEVFKHYLTFNKIREYKLKLAKEIEITTVDCPDLSRVSTLHINFIKLFNGFLFNVTQDWIIDLFTTKDQNSFQWRNSLFG